MKKEFKFLFRLSFIFYLCALTFILFLGFRAHIWYEPSLLAYIKNSSNFIPFLTISIYFESIREGSLNLDIPLKNLVGNFILFLPMGVYLPFFIKKLNNIWIFSISMIALLFIVEITQLVTRRGSFDIDDFILNLPGALIGFGIWKTKAVQKLLK